MAPARGVAKQALRALTGFAWTLPRVGLVEVFVAPWNVASLRTAEGAGYVRLGVPEPQDVHGRRVEMILAAARPGRP